MGNAATGSEGIFIDDLLLVDYLKNFLASTPPMKHDFRAEYHNQQSEAAYNPVSEKGIISVGTANNYTEAFAAKKNETLKNENKQLKFKTELAKIDAEVLRSENNKLHAEIERLKMQSQGTQTTLAILQSENTELRSQLEPLRVQILELTELSSSLMLQQNKNILAVEEVAEEGVEVCCSQQSVVAAAVEIKPQQIIVTAAHDVTTTSSHDNHLEKKMLSSLFTDNDSPVKDSPPRPISLNQKSSLKSIIIQRSKNAKVIKPQQKLEVKPSEAPVTPAKIEIQTVATTVTNQENLMPVALFDIKIEEPPQVHEQLLEQSESTGSTLKELDSNEIQLESVPTPKVIVKKNALSYAQMQQEADAGSCARAFKLTLTT